MAKLTVPPALKHRRFAIMWVAMLISTAGSQMQLWALFWHLRTMSDQPIVLSGIGLVRFVPILVFALIGGVVADLFNRRTVLFITQTTYALVALALGVLTTLGIIQIWHIYLLTAIQAVAISFDMPARQSLVPNLVPRDILPNAFSLQSIAQSTGSILGPAMSGILIAQFGQQYTYYFNALGYLAMLVALVQIGIIPQQAVPQQADKRKISLDAIREGIQFILSQPIILSSMLLDFFATFFSSANTLLPFVANDILKVGVIEYGWLSAAQAIGAVTVALVFSQRANIHRQGAILLGSVGVFGVATAVFGLSSSFLLTMITLILIGGSDTVSTILRNTIRQIQTPDFIRGRMVSINQIFFMGGPQLGEIEAGAVAQAFGIPASIVVGGVGCILAVLGVAVFYPQLRRYRGDEPAVG